MRQYYMYTSVHVMRTSDEERDKGEEKISEEIMAKEVQWTQSGLNIEIYIQAYYIQNVESWRH